MINPNIPKSIDVIGFGIAAVDDVLELDGFPKSDSKQPIVSVRRHGGGQCTTALVAAARLGMNCIYAGILGDNDLSDFIRQGLGREGIQVESRRPHPEARPYHSFILVDRTTGERTILYSGECVRGPEPDDIDEAKIAAANVLLIDQIGPSGTLHACRIARRLGVPIVADLERVDCDELREALALSDHLVMSARMASELTGGAEPARAVAQLAATPRACTAVTDGAHGCWFIEGGTDGKVQHQPAFPVSAVDTTGCGDVFHGAYAAALVLSRDVPGAIRFAAATSALKATRPGGQAGIPDRAAVEKFLND